MQHRLVDPRLKTGIPDHWKSICNIQITSYTLSDSNQKVPSGHANVAGLTNIQCRIGPDVTVRPTDDEQRAGVVIESVERRQCKLNGYFPQIVPRSMVALVDGVMYNIRGMEADSELFSTRLKLEVILP